MDRVLSYVRQVLNNEHHDEVDSTSTQVDPLPTIAWNGGVTLISPELSGFRSDRYDDFSCGNVLRTPLDQLIRTGMQATWVREHRRGIVECRIVSCPYFAFCGGGHPSNRYFEHGRMDGTETDYCRNSKIALMEGAINLPHNTRPLVNRIRDHETGFRELLQYLWALLHRQMRQQTGMG